MSNIEIDMDLVETDLFLDSWARARGLKVSKEFTEKVDRFIQVLDTAGNSYGLWIAPQDRDSVSIVIEESEIEGLRVPGHKVRTQSFTAKSAELGNALNSAYALAESWMHEKGQTRMQTPALF